MPKEAFDADVVVEAVTEKRWGDKIGELNTKKSGFITVLGLGEILKTLFRELADDRDRMINALETIKDKLQVIDVDQDAINIANNLTDVIMDPQDKLNVAAFRKCTHFFTSDGIIDQDKDSLKKTEGLSNLKIVFLG